MEKQQEQAAKIRTIVTELNSAIGEASRLGISVELLSESRQEMGDIKPVYVYTPLITMAI